MNTEQLELIHGDIDGINTAEQSSQLRALLEQDAEARELHADLRKITCALERVEELEAPSDLRSSVMGRVGELGSALLGTELDGGSVTPFRSSRSARLPWIGYAATLAAGIAIGFLGISLLTDPVGPDPNTGLGTFVPNTSTGAEPNATMSLRVGEGSIGIAPTGKGALLHVDGRTDDWQRLTLDFDPTVLSFSGVDPSTRGVTTETPRPGRIVFHLTGAPEFGTPFSVLRAGETLVEFSIQRDDRATVDGTFELSR